MTKDELYDAVFNLIDENASELSNEDYADLLSEIASDCSNREEAVRNDMEG